MVLLGSTKNLDLVMDSTISAFISSDDTYTSFLPTINVDSLSAPISKGSVVGTISYNIDGTIYTSNLLAGSDVEKSYLFIVVDIFIVIFLMIIFKLIITKKKFKKSKNRRKK